MHVFRIESGFHSEILNLIKLSSPLYEEVISGALLNATETCLDSAYDDQNVAECNREGIV